MIEKEPKKEEVKENETKTETHEEKAEEPKKEEKAEEKKKDTNKQSVMEPRYHIVKDKDTLKSIAKKYKIDIKDLKELNGVSDDKDIFIGNQLKLK